MLQVLIWSGSKLLAACLACKHGSLGKRHAHLMPLIATNLFTCEARHILCQCSAMGTMLQGESDAP